MCPRSSDSQPSRLGAGAGGLGAAGGAGGGVWSTIRTSRRLTVTLGVSPPDWGSRPGFCSPARGLFDSAGAGSPDRKSVV